MKDVQTLYISSDVIEVQIMGNSKAMLMDVFPVKGTHSEQESRQFNHRQYIGKRTSTIPRITIRIWTQTVEEVPVMIGDTHYRLHFRRKML